MRLEQERQRAEPDADALAQAERDYNAALAGIEAARVALTEVADGATDAQRQGVAGGLTAATAQRDAAAAELALLLAGGQTERVAIAEAGLAGARAALAEAEVEYEDHTSPSIYVEFPLPAANAADLTTEDGQALTDCTTQLADAAEVVAGLPALPGVGFVALVPNATGLARLLAYQPMLTPEKLRELRHPDWVCANDGITAALGWKPRIELSAGLRLTPGWSD